MTAVSVGIDLRVCSTDAADRGMGRYTRQLLTKSVQALPDTEHVVLRYPDYRRDLRDDGLNSAPNVRVVDIPVAAPSHRVPKDADVLQQSAWFQGVLQEAGVDVYHSTTPFIPPAFSDIDAFPYVATLYDLIPLIYPSDYLTTETSAEYARGIDHLRRADRVIAISESARNDAVSFLGIEPGRISVIHPWVDSYLSPMSHADTHAHLDRLGVPSEFVLAVTGVHRSKNLGVLLAAFSGLPATTRARFTLVLVVPTRGAYAVVQARQDLPAGVVVLESVSDEQLRALYSEATVVVHPSRYEGFGYPVVEAMACGAPVVTTTSSSMPEAAGSAAILLDPDDVQGFADAIQLVCDDATVRSDLVSRGSEQAARFSFENELRVDLATLFGQPTRHNSRPMSSRLVASSGAPRIALWSSVPPQPCGVADYTGDLLEPLAALATVEVFCGDEVYPDPAISARHTIHHASAFDRRQNQAPFDLPIYQMGGTYMQEFMFEPLRRQPGIVVLHDLLMALGFFWIHRSNDALGAFRTNVVAVEGQDATRAYDRALRISRESGDEIVLRAVFDKHPMLQWIIDSSVAQVVHTQALAAELKRRYPSAAPHVIDMGVSDPWAGLTEGDRQRFRAGFGLRPSTRVVASFGTVIPIKRLRSVADAVGRLRRSGVDCRLVVAGDIPDASYGRELSADLDRLGVSHAVHLLGRVGRHTFDRLLIACDVVANLRFPSMKGMSATLQRAVAAGKPVLISDVHEWDSLPESCCPRVPAGDDEIPTLVETLGRLLLNDDELRRCGAAARSHYLEHGTAEGMARGYVELIESLQGGDR